jgi:Protein of unknown function (DUF3568)
MIAKALSIIAAIVFGVSLMLQGCVPLVAAGAGAAAGAGTIAYTEGSLDTTYAASVDRTWNATMAALKDSQLNITEQQKDAAQATIKARRADNTPVTVSMKQAGSNTTTVKIRVGTFGDEEASRAINSRIAAHLGTRAS